MNNEPDEEKNEEKNNDQIAPEDEVDQPIQAVAKKPGVQSMVDPQDVIIES